MMKLISLIVFSFVLAGFGLEVKAQRVENGFVGKINQQDLEKYCNSKPFSSFVSSDTLTFVCAEKSKNQIVRRTLKKNVCNRKFGGKRGSSPSLDLDLRIDGETCFNPSKQEKIFN